MEQKTVPTPVIAALISLAVIVVGFFLYRTVVGGTVGDGKEGNVQASPPGQQHAPQGSASARGAGARTP